MSREINKLIPKLRFPEYSKGDEWIEKIFDDLCFNISSGKDKNLVSGEFNLFGSTGIIGKTETPSFDGVYILVARVGANAGLLNRVNGLFGVTDNTLVVNLKEPKNIDFIFYTLDKIGLNKLVFGSGQPLITGKQLKELIISIPKNPKEQKKIASCLSSLDNIIAAQIQKLDALKDHKKGLMQNLFPQEGETVPKLRFPEFQNDGDWVEKRFEQLFVIGNGRDYKHLEKGDIPVFGSGGYMLSVDEYLYDGESACIGRKGTIDKPIFLTGKFWTVDTLFYTHSFKGCIPKFIYYIFQNINWLNHNEAGGVPSLSKTNIYKIETLIPKPKEQNRIVDFLTGLDDLITAQADKIEQLKLHKKGLMQGLFPKVNN